MRERERERNSTIGQENVREEVIPQQEHKLVVQRGSRSWSREESDSEEV